MMLIKLLIIIINVAHMWKQKCVFVHSASKQRAAITSLPAKLIAGDIYIRHNYHQAYDSSLSRDIVHLNLICRENIAPLDCNYQDVMRESNFA